MLNRKPVQKTRIREIKMKNVEQILAISEYEMIIQDNIH